MAPETDHATLLAEWTALMARVEWVCHTGIGRFFAPWDPPTSEEYARAVADLFAAVRAMAERGAIVPRRSVGMLAATGAHALRYPARADLALLGARDRMLREAFAPPAPLAGYVRARVPAGPWPLPQYIAPPPAPALPERG